MVPDNRTTTVYLFEQVCISLVSHYLCITRNKRRNCHEKLWKYQDTGNKSGGFSFGCMCGSWLSDGPDRAYHIAEIRQGGAQLRQDTGRKRREEMPVQVHQCKSGAGCHQQYPLFLRMLGTGMEQGPYPPWGERGDNRNLPQRPGSLSV